MLAFLKFTLTKLKQNFFSVAFLYVIFPILMVFYYGFIMGDTINSKTNVETPTLKVVDEDNTDLSKMLVGVLSSEDFNTVYTIQSGTEKNSSEKQTTEEKTDYKLIIPKGFMDAVDNKSEFSLNLIGSKDTGNLEGKRISSFISSLNASLLTNYNITSGIIDNDKNTSEVKNKITNDYINLQSELQKSFAEIETINLENKINPYELYAIMLISFLFFMITLAPIQQAAKNKNLGFEMRLVSAPMSFTQLFTAKVISSAIECFILTALYILFFRYINLAFTANIGLVFLYLIPFSLLAGVLANTLMLSNNKSVVRSLASVFFLIFVVGGQLLGTMLFSDNDRFAKILKFNIINILNDPLNNIALGRSNAVVFKGIGIIFLIAVIIYCIALVAGKLRKSRV